MTKDFLKNICKNRQLWSVSNQATLLWWKKHWTRRFTKITKIILFPLKGKTTKPLLTPSLTQFNPCLFGILLWKTNLNKMKRSLMGWISKMKSNLTSRKLAGERGLKQSPYRLSITMTPKSRSLFWTKWIDLKLPCFRGSLSFCPMKINTCTQNQTQAKFLPNFLMTISKKI